METTNIAYLMAVKQHLLECEQDLNEIRDIIAEREWSRMERSAAERRLQVLIESCIGLAKHLAKKEFGYTAPEPRQVFSILTEKKLIDVNVPWKKVIGLRNALVHDYLEVDQDIVREVINDNQYQGLLSFARQAMQRLQPTTP